MANLKKYIEECTKNNIVPSEIDYSVKSSMELALFEGKREKFTISEDSRISGRGMYEGKVGSFMSDTTTREVPLMMAKNIIESAKYGREYDSKLFIEKGLKYKKLKSYHPELEVIDATKLEEIAQKVHDGMCSVDKTFEREVDIEYIYSVNELVNSNGLKLKTKSNFVEVVGSCVAREGDSIESGFDVAILTDLTSFDAYEFGRKLALETVYQLHGNSVKSGKYNVILDQDVVSKLLKFTLSKLSAFDIQHNLSLLKDTLGVKKFSSKLTVDQCPISKSVFASSFDGEGMPKANMKLVKNGVIMNYLYDLETASIDGVSSNGCASKVGSTVRPSLDYLVVKPGKKSLEEMASEIKDGLIINSINGEHSGLDATSGNFSLQASGKLVENGKITTPISLITIAGNLNDFFANIICVGNDVKETMRGVKTPSIAIKKVSISGFDD